MVNISSVRTLYYSPYSSGRYPGRPSYLDAVTVACGFLPDVVEDTEKTLDDLEMDFGTDGTNIVDGVTKLGKVEYKSHEERWLKTCKVLMAMSGISVSSWLNWPTVSPRNMRVPKASSQDNQKSAFLVKPWKLCSPWLTVWVLVVSNGRWKICPSVIYGGILQISHMMKENRRGVRHLWTVVDKVRPHEQELVGDIYGRQAYLLCYRRCATKKSASIKYDLVPSVCVMETHSDVYTMLGYIHELWRPIPCTKDYIANPKSNGYQSLSIQRFMDQKDLLKSNPYQGMHQLPNTGLQLTLGFRKGSGQGRFKKSPL